LLLRVRNSTVFLLLASRAAYRIGVLGRRNDFIYNLPVAPPDPAAHYLKQAACTAIPFGVDPETADLRPELYLTDEERAVAEGWWAAEFRMGSTATDVRRGSEGARPRPSRLLVNISAGDPVRRWPDERFATVIRAVRERFPEVQVAVAGVPGEGESVARIAAETGVVRVPPVAVRQALTLVSATDYVFTPDTAIAHVAAVLDKPAVVMIPPASVWEPSLTRGRIVSSPESTLGSLPTQPVIDAVTTMLGGRASRLRDARTGPWTTGGGADTTGVGASRPCSA
jgi:ADP-heptose:LPS heptosyltransferase